jgi:transcriptional regulator with XRE-family HTH domain
MWYMTSKRRNRLISERKKRKLNQEDVAKILGTSRIHYSQIERGVRNPSFELTEKIIEFYGIDVRGWR